MQMAFVWCVQYLFVLKAHDMYTSRWRKATEAACMLRGGPQLVFTQKRQGVRTNSAVTPPLATVIRQLYTTSYEQQPVSS